jgi:RNA polymerase sigma factor (sigma-70 family)
VPGGPLKTAVRHFKQVLTAPVSEEWSDRQLLDRFAREHDELAFAGLVRRHGALVLGVSRRVLQHEQDAEDVFQASFLILARKAASKGWQPSIAGWLYCVSYRLAVRSRARISRQRRLERQAGAGSDMTAANEDCKELYSALDEELEALRDPYREPLLLCYLEGKTRDQAARQLGWSLRTLERRLGQGLNLLRARLTRRGIEVPAALLAAGLSQQAASAAVSASVLGAVAHAAVAFRSGTLAVGGAVSAEVAALAQAGMRAMAMSKLKIGLVVLLTAGALAAGLGALGHRLLATEPPKQSQAAQEKPAAPPPPTAWPAGTTVTGRVVNQKGEPVANADVLLLGPERIMVEANRKTWFVFEGDRSAGPPSTRTNSRGHFSIQRLKSKADRLAVIADDPLFWVISRKSLARGDEIEIKLPPSGSLAIHCNLPSKAAKQPVMIVLRTFDGVAWDTDALRFHCGEFAVPNPGEAVFEHLPPAVYSVERSEEVRTGSNSVLMNLADRQSAKVKPGKRAVIRFEHKVGHPLVGQVRGLENVQLRYANVTIMYAGPEERQRNGKTYRQYTTFEAIPIGSDGRFKTDPLPPGKYFADLFAVCSSTPEQSSQQADFWGHLDFTVPDRGALPELVVSAKPNKSLRPASTDCRVRVIDETGKPVVKPQAMLHTAEAGYRNWTDGGLGVVCLADPDPFRGAEVIDVLLRADGYAPAIVRFDREQRQKLRQGQPTIMLKRGQKVELQFRLPQGLTWPKGVLPDAYFKEMEGRVQMMRQPANRKDPSDFNMLNLHEAGPGRFAFRLAADTPPFFVGIHAPGFLQYFDAGPFTLADVKQGVLAIDAPRPASLGISFDRGVRIADAVPFKAVGFNVMRQIEGNAYLDVAAEVASSRSHELKLTDLSPGHYYIRVGTQPRSEETKVPGTEIDRGKYGDWKELDLRAGQSEPAQFGYVPFDPDAFHGKHTAVVRILTADGTPAKGRHAKIGYYDGHYGSLAVFSGVIPDSGEIILKGITDRVTFAPDRSYSVTVEDKSLGHFGFTKGQSTEVFEFHLTPQTGDMAPDVELQNLATGKGTRLSELRGKIVCLEFWATWCGPCQPAMAKLNILSQEQPAAWKDRVVLLPVSIDTNRERVTSHVTQRGWDRLMHHWAGTETKRDWDAPAVRAFVVSGVPETILIGRDGRILWRGHPADNSGGQDLRSRIETALAR